MELHAAIFGALQEGGTALLAMPQRFLGYVLDLADQDDPLLAVFESNCDAELMGIFAEAARNMSPETALNAVNLATALLVDVRYIHPNIAKRLASEIAWGLCDYTGTPLPSELRAVTEKSTEHLRDAWTTSDGITHTAGGTRYTPGGTVLPPQGSQVNSDGYATVTSQTPEAQRSSATTGSPQYEYVNGDYMPASTPEPPKPPKAQPKAQPKRSPIGLIIAIVAVIAVAGVAGFFVLSSGMGSAASPAKSQAGSPESAETSEFIGTWKPASVIVSNLDEQSHEAKLRTAQEGELTIRDDGTFTRSVFPDLLDGKWEKGKGSTIELVPSVEKGELYSWDSADLAKPILVTLDSDKLDVSYADGVEVTYEKGAANFSTDAFAGLWQVEELTQGGVLQYGKDVFDADHAAGWYTEYLDVRGNGTIVWDRQSDKSEGSWRMASDSSGVFFIRDVRENGAYWCGIMVRNGDKVLFYFGGEGDFEKFAKAQTDDRANLKIPER